MVGVGDEVRQQSQRRIGERLAVVVRRLIAVVTVLKPTLAGLCTNQTVLGGVPEQVLECQAVGLTIAGEIRRDGQSFRPCRLRSGPAVNPCSAVRIAVCARKPNQFISFGGRHAIEQGEVSLHGETAVPK